MEKCLDCNSTLKKGEKACYACGAQVPVVNPKASLNQRFALVIKIVMYASAALTVASLFVTGLSFMKSSAVTLVLFIVKSSADEMLEKKKT